jgi:UDP-N-acetylmuramoyl-L-alanyl-D-glutamate--2,6-diaminopimelate ligase
MQLRDLLSDDAVYERRFAALDIGGLAADSRRVKPGDLFAALPGSRADGLEFVPQAVAAGAKAILAQDLPSRPLPDGVALIRTRDPRRALALAAARFFPRQPATIAAVTGTSGKTSVATFTRQIWTALGRRAASLGTLGLTTPAGEVYGSLTTPDPIELHRTLDALAADAVTHLAMEASSHGLDQRRLDGVRVAVAAFTNLSRDHLDYHSTPEAYLKAKLRLFEELLPHGGLAVVDVDHDGADEICAAVRRRGLPLLTVGRRGEFIRLSDATIDGFAQDLTLSCGGRRFVLRLPLVGGFQVENALVAAALAIASGEQPDRVFAALEAVKGAKGRLERVAEKNRAPIFIDYAHKPDALAKTLDALRPYVRNRLIVVFGAGGDRDQGKRPLMGAIAAEKADRVIVTDDNPRTEDAASIRAAILATAPGATEIGDRREAIRYAVEALAPGDVLVIAGKGHESGQIVGERVLPFSDHEAVAAAFKEKVA